MGVPAKGEAIVLSIGETAMRKVSEKKEMRVNSLKSQLATTETQMGRLFCCCLSFVFSRQGLTV